MTQEKVLGIEQYYDLDLDLPTIASAPQTPFNCDAYGRLCDILLPAEAQDHARKVWQALDNRLPIGQIIQKSHKVSSFSCRWAMGHDQGRPPPNRRSTEAGNEVSP